MGFLVQSLPEREMMGAHIPKSTLKSYCTMQFFEEFVSLVPENSIEIR